MPASTCRHQSPSQRGFPAMQSGHNKFNTRLVAPTNCIRTKSGQRVGHIDQRANRVFDASVCRTERAKGSVRPLVTPCAYSFLPPLCQGCRFSGAYPAPVGPGWEQSAVVASAPFDDGRKRPRVVWQPPSSRSSRPPPTQLSSERTRRWVKTAMLAWPAPKPAATPSRSPRWPPELPGRSAPWRRTRERRTIGPRRQVAVLHGLHEPLP